jgi:two-component system CheB/CheR fusion protein
MAPVINVTSVMLSPEVVKKHPVLNNDFSYCEIIFSDNGIGFDKQFSEKMFLIFQRLHSREHFTGTGIGLALCKRIVLNHQGEIYAESGDGEGSEFHVILPLKQ